MRKLIYARKELEVAIVEKSLSVLRVEKRLFQSMLISISFATWIKVVYLILAD